MKKVILFLLFGVIIVAVAWVVSGIPGHVVASVGGVGIDTSAPMALLMLVLLVIATMFALAALRSLWTLPRKGARWRRRRQVAAGEKAITAVLVALAAGDSDEARRQSRKARRLLGNTPQTLLLVAEAGRLSGREDEAEEAFRALTKQPNAAFLGLRGLLRQAVERHDWQEALVVAKQAEAAHPGTLWLRQQRAELALETANWAEALELLGPDPRRTTYCVAAANAESDPRRALSFAKQAWKQDPAFAPAALAYASRLREMGQEKRAQLCIADAWKRSPHPDLAKFALSLEPDKTARALAAKQFVASNPTHPESRMLLAQVALDAGHTGEARQQIEAARSEGLHQRRLCLLLADIEDRERGDTEEGRLAQRDALRQAATAEPDPRWQCTSCSTNYEAWHPRCPTCSQVGTIVWLETTQRSVLPVAAA
jgi:HemY protein